MIRTISRAKSRPWLRLAASLFLATGAVPEKAEAEDVMTLDSVVITASRHAEPLSQVASTIQVIDEEKIRKSSARSVTDLLSENAAGFFSEWTPGQTSVNFRGGATEGQGRDFRSQVLILINGRRAGTANLSKLSLNDLERIEIIRGPASVVYGSQAIGGVINIITRNGRDTKGNMARGEVGTSNFMMASGYTAGDIGKTNYYVGTALGGRDDYTIPGGVTEVNTGYKRKSALAAIGADLVDDVQVDTTFRSDGIYDAGFRGSQWDTNNRESRFNESFDGVLTKGTPNDALSVTTRTFVLRDVDDLAWGSEVSTTGALGYSLDHNRRELNVFGLHVLPQVKLNPSTDVLFGGEYEHSQLRNSRFRIPVPGAAATQVAPFDNNDNTDTLAAFTEGVHRLDDDRTTLRAGLRHTYSELSTRQTPNQTLLQATGRHFDYTTYSTGVAHQLEDWVKLRAGIATGFRAPTATELGALFTAVGGSQVLGNSSLKPENSRQYEIGITFTPPDTFIDVALFQNTIKDRIVNRTITTTLSQTANSTGDAVIEGIEIIGDYNVAHTAGWTEDRLRLYGNAVWNFRMQDLAPDAALQGTYRSRVQRMYEYQASLSTLYGKTDWDFRFTSILHGPMYYDTEEILLIPAGEPNSRNVDRKHPFFVFNTRGNYYLTPAVTMFGTVNNLFDQNYHPTFIALDQQPYISNPIASNGGRGNSMPGREFFVGMEIRF